MKHHPGFREMLADAIEGFKAAPGRLLVMGMALFIGSSALALLLATVGGLNRQARDMVREFGVNVFAVSPDRQARSGANLTMAQVELARAGMPGRVVSAVSRRDAPFGHEGRPIAVWQTDEHLARVRRWALREGRFFDAADIEQMARVAVISDGLSRRWGVRAGDHVRLRNTPYEVIGVLAEGEGMVAREEPDAETAPAGELAIYLPWSTPSYWSNDARRWNQVDTIYVQSAGADGVARDMATCRALLEAEPSLRGALTWVSQGQLLARVRRMQQVIYWTLGSVTLLCLVMGGTILLSVMTGNVRDRIPEIGIRRALGATRREVAQIFILEAAALTSMAGVLASALVHGALLAWRARLPMPVAFGAGTLFWPVLVSVLVGVACSYLPARMAARIAPSEALRNE